MFWGILLALIGVFSVIPENKENGSSKQYTSKPYIPQNIGKNKPEGEAPPGMVWSAEHGHWHDAKNPHDAFSAGMKKSGDNYKDKVRHLLARSGLQSMDTGMIKSKNI